MLETKFRYACYVRTSLEQCSNRNTHVFYEIKKPNKIGGLVNMLPKRDRVFFVTSAAVSWVTRYLHTSVSPITPTVPKGTRLLQPQPAHTGTHSTEPPQPPIQASKSPRYVNTLTQHTQHHAQRLFASRAPNFAFCVVFLFCSHNQIRIGA